MYLYNGIIVTMNKKRDIYDRGWVKINGEGIIEDVGKGDDKFSNGIDLNGDLLVPGFVNGHTHLAMTLLRGYADDLPLKEWLENYIWPAEGKFIDREAVILGTKLGVMELLRSGTTTFLDMYFFTDDLYPIIEEIGIRGFLAEGIIDFPTPNKKNPVEAIKYVKESILKWKDNVYGRVALSVHAPYSTSPDIIEEVAGLASESNIIFTAHVSETVWEVEEIKKRYGKTPLKHMSDLIPEGVIFSMAHAVHLTIEEMALAADRGFSVFHCPQSNLKLSSGIAKVQILKDEGVTVGIGTDGTASNNNLDIIDEMRTAALIGKLENPEHVSAEYVLEMATINGARALGIDKETGSIERNKWADLVRISLDGIESYPYYGNPYSYIVYAMNSRDVKSTFVKGKLLYDSGEFKTIDADKTKREVRNWQEKLL